MVLSSSQMGKYEVINLKKTPAFSLKKLRRGERYKTIDSWKHQYIWHLGTAADLQPDPSTHRPQGLTNIGNTPGCSQHFWNKLLGTLLQARFSTLHLAWQFFLSKSGILGELKTKKLLKSFADFQKINKGAI